MSRQEMPEPRKTTYLISGTFRSLTEMVEHLYSEDHRIVVREILVEELGLFSDLRDLISSVHDLLDRPQPDPPQ